MARNTDTWIGLRLSSGRYHVISKLGEGGMGHVFRAHDQSLDTDVVIKAPRRAMLEEPEFAERFAREIRSMVKLAHPHIVRVSDVGEYEGLPFAVMQYLPGGSLDDQRKTDSEARPLPMRPEELLGWLEPVADALDFVHREHFIHRDIKPANILFDAHGNAYLSDFGIAKILAESREAAPARTLTGAGMVLGTPEYMAPELVMGQPYDGRVDQYALAVTVYEVLCGRRPFEGPTPSAVMVRQTTYLPPQLHEFHAAVPRAVSAAVFKALAKDPGQRYPDCASFARMLVQAIRSSELAKRTSARSAGPEKLRLVCPLCGVELAVPNVPGKELRCPACQGTLQVAENRTELTVPALRGETTTVRKRQQAAAPGRSGAARRPAAPPEPGGPQTATLERTSAGSEAQAAPKPRLQPSSRFMILGGVGLAALALVGGFIALRPAKSHSAAAIPSRSSSLGIPVSLQRPCRLSPRLCRRSPSRQNRPKPLQRPSAPRVLRSQTLRRCLSPSRRAARRGKSNPHAPCPPPILSRLKRACRELRASRNTWTT